MAVGTVIGGTAQAALACFEDAGQILVGDGDGGVGLVVFEQYVVAGLVALDEIVLKQQGILFAVDDNIADVSDLETSKRVFRVCWSLLK